jgi:exosortase/archaeosortase family protein
LGYTQDKKAKRKQNQNQDLFLKKIKAGWIQKKPIIFFVCGFGILMVLFYLVWQSEFFISRVQPFILSINATLSSRVLNVFGFQTQANNSTVYSSFYSVDISRGCDAIEAMALFLATTLSFPMSLKSKITGLFAGVSILFILNIIRIVTLFWAGLYFPSFFETLHVQLWPILIILCSLFLWIQLVRMDRRKKHNGAH